ncbi:MAG: amidase domain-containing protein [Oscillospiraceae bacterium]|jgi:hypothetical protein|nr:amidase domain-containing protein [Oscillospiraceae bacterium]
MAYDRDAAVRYAHEWVYRRNPKYYDFSEPWGDCTNFVSQAFLAGGAPQEFSDNGWYYRSADDRAPAWTSVQHLYEYLTRGKAKGLRGEVIDLAQAQPGDLIQLSFKPDDWGHSLLIVHVGENPDPSNVLIAAHSNDNDFRPLATYTRAIAHRVLRIEV